MTSAILEFFILGRVAGFGVVAYGAWLTVRNTISQRGTQLQRLDNPTKNTLGDL
jgi:hypothetical protein